jgi:hypothetical protein
MYIIYKHTNIINDLAYIGYTCQTIENRWKAHIKSSLKQEWKFSQAIKQIPYQFWDHEILIDNILTLEEAKKLEIEMIAKYNTYYNGYNMNLGGSGRQKYTMSEKIKKKISQATKLAMSRPEIKKKMSEFQKKYFKEHPEKHPMKGKKHSQASIEKMSNSHLQMTEETKKKIGQGSKKTWKNPETRKKRIHHLQNMSPETRQKMSFAKKGKPSWNKGKKWPKETIEKMRQTKLGKRKLEVCI